MVKKNKEELKEGDVVLGKVDKISGETVFVDIGKGKRGTIVTSEVAPGRIRNLRDYVSPNKKIVCKVLEKGKNNIHLSLRRVTEKEKDKVMKEHERRKSCKKILQTVLEKNGEDIIKEIEKNEGNLYQFLQDSKEDSKKLEKYIDKDKAKKVIEILKKRKGKQVKIHSKIKLTTIQEKGLDKIKDILGPFEENIKYQSNGIYILTIKEKDYKKANKKRDKILDEIREKAKKEGMEFEIEEK